MSRKASPERKEGVAYGFGGIRSSASCASPNQIAARPSIDSLSAPLVAPFFNELGHFLDFLFENQPATTFPFNLRSRAQENEHGERQLPFAQIGPERFAGGLLVSGDVEAIIVNLIGRSDSRPEIP